MSGTGELMSGCALVQIGTQLKTGLCVSGRCNVEESPYGTTTHLVKLYVLMIHPLHELHNLAVGQGAHIRVLIDDPLGWSVDVHDDRR